MYFIIDLAADNGFKMTEIKKRYFSYSKVWPKGIFQKADEKLDFNEKIGGTFSSSILQTSTSLCNKLSKSLRNFVKN